MSRYRRVDVKVWQDTFFSSLSDDAKLIWLYLLTSQQTQSCGIFTLSRDIACRDLRWTSERFAQRFAELLGNASPDTMQWDEDHLVVFLPRWVAYNPPANGNTIRSWVPMIEALPEASPLIEQWYHAVKPLLERFRQQFAIQFTELFAERFAQRIGNHRSKDQDQDQDPPLPPRGGDLLRTHPPIDPDRIDSSPDLSWVVRQAFVAQYGERYGHPPKWSERKDTPKAREMVAYLQSIADAWGRGKLDSVSIEKAVKRMTDKFLNDNDDFVTRAQHSFPVFCSRADRYVQKKVNQ